MPGRSRTAPDRRPAQASRSWPARSPADVRHRCSDDLSRPAQRRAQPRLWQRHAAAGCLRRGGRPAQGRLAEGLAVTWRQPFLRAAAGCSAAVNFVLQGVTLAIIVLAKDRGASAQLVGIILGGKGIGGLAGACAAPWLQRRAAAGLVIIGDLWIWGAALAAMATVGSPVWLCPLVVVIGFTAPLWNVAVQTYRLRLIPNELLGRVSSVTMQLGWGAVPLGSLAAGYLLAGLGAAGAMLVLAAAMTLTAAAATATPAIRRTIGPAQAD